MTSATALPGPATTAGPGGTRRPQRASRRRLAAGPSFLYAVPALVMFVAFAIIPLVVVSGLSFTNWDGIGVITPAGLNNWIAALGDPETWHSLGLTLLVMVLCWVIQTPLALLLGVFTAGKQKYRAVFAVLFFVPLLISSAAIAIAWRALLDPNFGLGASSGLRWLARDWLGNPDTVLYVVVIIIAWQYVPFHALLYQGGVQQIPESMYEAATLDGAGRIAQFFHITLPQLRNTVITSSTLILVGSLTYFDIVYVLTQGGPGTSTRILPLQMYLTGFVGSNMGAASVLAIILVALGLILSLTLTRLTGFSRMTSDLEGA
ncbi:Sugar ABC transporter permease [Microbacterium sp. 8M]|uniref:carbohydrate ABC transporter permease n=1 Tax=Microbacterium sp. 8M TaxID=2653153 RepID=UPI0012F457DE|nr:Sugar ABC transporter permease [Microbacterium sp. 8M]